MKQMQSPKILIARAGLALSVALAAVPFVVTSTSGGVTQADSAAQRFSIQTWQTEDGLPQGTINALVQSRDGYLWIGTYSGAARFDGVRFKVFDSANTGMRNSRITSLCEDSSGNLWFGHETGDLTKLSKGAFEPVDLGQNWPGGAVQSIGQDEQNRIWLVSVDGHALCLTDGRVLERFPGIGSEPGGSPDLARDLSGQLLVSRNGVIASLQSGQWSTLSFDSAITYYSRACPALKGGLWVAGDGLVRRWEAGRWLEQAGDLPGELGFITTITETRSGKVLLGTITHGLLVYEPGSPSFAVTTRTGLPQNWVKCLLEDREGNIWVGTRGGLSVLRRRKVLVCAPPDEWRNAVPLSTTSGANGSVWAATEGAGLYHFDGNSWRRFAEADGLLNPYVWSVLEDSSGTVWAGTWSGGLFRRKQGVFAIPEELAQLKDPITALLENPPGTLWIGTGKGLVRLREGRVEHFGGLGGAAVGDIRALEMGGEGELWIGTLGRGLGRFSSSGLKTYTSADGLPGDSFPSMHYDSDGTLWIGTLEKGVCRFKAGRFSTIASGAELPGNAIGHIAEDERGWLWFNSSQGVFAASKADLNRAADGGEGQLTFLVYGRPEGLTAVAGAAGFAPSGFKDTQGRIWVPNAKGLAVVDPSQVEVNRLKPLLAIEEVTIEGRPAQMTHAGTVRAPPGSQQVEIRFTALSFSAPQRVRFKWRLDGFERQWSEPHAERVATYSYLPPGEYVFRLLASNNDGIWNDTPASLELAVLPFFWQTMWFKLAGSTAGLLLFGGGIVQFQRGRLRRKLERARRENELERERARIAQDIHDDLGASLTRIGMLSQTAGESLENREQTSRYLTQIYGAAREMTRGMDEIVWAVNPRHDTLESLFNYLTRFAHEFLTPAKIRCRLEIPVEFPERSVRSEIRHNLFLAFKETLNNAVLHSGADEVKVAVQLEGEFIRIAVSDNGRGSQEESSPTMTGLARIETGHGLENIRARLERIGGHAQINSAPGQGMSILLAAPVSGETVRRS